MYLDDVSIIIDGEHVFNDDFSDDNPIRTILVNSSHVHLTGDEYHSPTYGLALECNSRHDDKNGFGSVDLTKTIDEGWSKLNVTFFIRIPEDNWLDQEERVSFSVSFYERKDSSLDCTSYQGSAIFIHGNGSAIHRTQIRYFGEDNPEVYNSHTPIDLGSYGWHRLEFTIDKPSLIVLFDDCVVCETSAVQGYFTDMMVFNWWTFFEKII